MIANSSFTTGWMCPLYKKKERKALAIQATQIIHKLIHPNQSGFILRRSIFDPIRLAQTMMVYVDLFETLETFKLPKMFIDTIKNPSESREVYAKATPCHVYYLTSSLA